MDDDSEAKQRGYRYYKQLATVRLGYGFIRDTIADFLVSRRWELGRSENVKTVALELVDQLMEAGALSLYQCGIDVENSKTAEERQRRKHRELHETETRHAVEEARAEERVRVDRRLAELENERLADEYLAKTKRALELEEQFAAKKSAAQLQQLQPPSDRAK